MRGGHTKADAEFIAHARVDIPALVAEVERLQEKVGRQDEYLADLEHQLDVDARHKTGKCELCEHLEYEELIRNLNDAWDSEDKARAENKAAQGELTAAREDLKAIQDELGRVDDMLMGMGM